MILYYFLNFMAFCCLQGGRPGIYIAPWLLNSDWSEMEIGYILFCYGVARMLAQTPLGSLVDWSANKLWLLAFANAAVVLPCLWIYIMTPTDFKGVNTCMIMISLGEALAYPALYAVSRGLVSKEDFPDRIKLNEQFNHAGNVFFALSAGLTTFVAADPSAFFLIVVVLGICSILCCVAIQHETIDEDRASGRDVLLLETERGTDSSDNDLSFEVYILLLVAFLFHFGNASMLPLIAQYLSKDGGTVFTSAAILIAQFFMYVTASQYDTIKSIMKQRHVLLLALCCIPVRGIIIAILISNNVSSYTILTTQILDGIAGGIVGVTFVMYFQSHSKGNFGFLLGGFKFMEAIGGALSNIGGEAIAHESYLAAFVSLSVVGLVPCLLSLFLLKDDEEKDKMWDKLDSYGSEHREKIESEDRMP